MQCIIEIKDSQFKTYGDESLTKMLKALPDGIYDIEIKKHKNIRSIQQNRYYWKIVIPFIANFFNSYGRVAPMTPPQAHAQFKEIAGLYEEVQIYDKEKQTLQTKKLYLSFSNAGELSTIDFNNACDIVREAINILSNGIYILPQPIKTNNNL